jgi:hypothetical protein
MMQKRLVIFAIVLAGLFLFYKLAFIFAPGSYPNAELYELSYPQDKVIDAITKLKASDSELIVPKVTIQGKGQFDLSDGKENESDKWFKFYFYDKVKNEIILTWTRPLEQNKTSFAFVSVNKGLDIGEWKDINKDFETSENKKIKAHFEATILKKIKENLANN